MECTLDSISPNFTMDGNMALKIISAGFGHTGTMSTFTALQGVSVPRPQQQAVP